mgnify:FL=1
MVIHSTTMIIFGIDPGIARVGWAIIHEEKGKQNPVAYGCITTKKETALPDRLLSVHKEITKLFSTYHPDVLSLEELFFAKNEKTAIMVGEARGVVLLAAAQHRIGVVSYSPPSIKLAICGHGKAEKLQVQRMVTRLLHLKEIPKPDDTADALAIALTHAYSYKMKGLL